MKVILSVLLLAFSSLSCAETLERSKAVMETKLNVSVLKGLAADKMTSEQSKVYGNFEKAVGRAALTNSKGLKSLVNASSCTEVFHACGSCGGNNARVDYYCDGGGSGSSPDFSTCEPC